MFNVNPYDGEYGRPTVNDMLDERQKPLLLTWINLNSSMDK